MRARAPPRFPGRRPGTGTSPHFLHPVAGAGAQCAIWVCFGESAYALVEGGDRALRSRVGFSKASMITELSWTPTSDAGAPKHVEARAARAPLGLEVVRVDDDDLHHPLKPPAVPQHDRVQDEQQRVHEDEGPEDVQRCCGAAARPSTAGRTDFHVVAFDDEINASQSRRSHLS